ncbi:MAG: mannitol dehydrogenase family protein, partial [Holdemania filiformis]
MRLTDEGLKDRQVWLDHGYTLPQYDRGRMRQATLATPRWIHFGAGNIFRAYQTRLMQKLIEAGEVSEGLIAAEGYDDEIVDGMLNPHDDLNILVTLKASGSVEKTVIGSLAAALKLDPASTDFTTLRNIFIQPSLQLASFTITEKGYRVRDEKGQILPEIAAEFERGPQAARSYIGKVAALLSARYQNGALPIALVSMDNCSHNGEKLKQAIVTMAEGWTRAGKMEAGFLDYVQDEGQVSFPWTMIDKITPRPDPAIEALLKQDGVEDVSPIITARHTYIAPFVNAEECEYLVVEDRFPNGRPPLEKAGVMFADRQTVEQVERMKVSTCLNPVHTGLAVFGCLLGFTKISAEMQDPDLKRLAERIGRVEGLPVVTNPGILAPEQFLDEVLTLRIPNPFMPDTPQRIATDTSQKLGVRFGETVKAYLKEGRPLSDLKAIPLVYAGWLRYLLGIDDQGQPMPLSPD